MRITMKTLSASPTGALQRGQTYDLPPERARRLVERGFATLAEDDPAAREPAAAKKTAVKKTAAKKTAAKKTTAKKTAPVAPAPPSEPEPGTGGVTDE